MDVDSQNLKNNQTLEAQLIKFSTSPDEKAYFWCYFMKASKTIRKNVSKVLKTMLILIYTNVLLQIAYVSS